MRIPYTDPKNVGISRKSILDFAGRLDSEVTEPHGLLVYRHGSICAEGYWKPYTKGMVHGMQSLTKTFAGTAIGVAVTEGILGLDERLADIFKEEMPFVSQPHMDRLMRLKVRHLLSMSTGMVRPSDFAGNWIVNFLSNPIVDEPGTAFFYNSVGSTMLGEIIRRKTGLTLGEYLEKHLYEKIDIDPKKMKWLSLEDGMEIGGSGLYCTVQNVLRLSILYLNEGKYDGKQVLSKEFAKAASTMQTNNMRTDGIKRDGEAGYGFQMWMTLREGGYCMAGAMGQLAVMLPKEDMILIVTTRTGDESVATSGTLFERIWQFIEDGVDKEAEEDIPYNEFTKKMAELSLPAITCDSYGAKNEFAGNYIFKDENLDIAPGTGGIMQVCFQPVPAKTMNISFPEDACRLVISTDQGEYVLIAGMDGRERYNTWSFPPFPVKYVAAQAYFKDETLCVHVRWTETCYSYEMRFFQEEDGLRISRQYEGVDPRGPIQEYLSAAYKE